MSEETHSQVEQTDEDPGLNAPEASEDDVESLFDALLNMTGEDEGGEQQQQQQTAEGEQTGEQQSTQTAEGDEGEGEGDQTAELSPLQQRFLKEDGSFDSESALKAIEDLGGLHSATAKERAEDKAYINRLERALEAVTKGAEGGESTEQTKQVEGTKKLLPEGFGGTLTEEDAAFIQQMMAGTVRGDRQQQQAASAQAQENAQVERGEIFSERSQSLADNFEKTYRVSKEQGDAMNEILRQDPELIEATQNFILKGGVDFPEELLNKKFIQAYGHVTQNTSAKESETKSGDIDIDAIAEKIAARLGITRESQTNLAKERVDDVSRDTEHPIQAIEGAGEGEGDYFEEYLKSRGMENMDPSLKMLLREMETGTPN